MSKEKIAGFMLGLSAGFVAGYLLKPPNDTGISTSGHEGDADLDFDQSAKSVRTSPGVLPDRGKHSIPIGAKSREPS